MEKVTVVLDKNGDELFEMKINLDEFSDQELQKILIKELCGKDGAFCFCCLGEVKFRISRECPHKLLIYPQKDGKDLNLVMASDK